MKEVCVIFQGIFLEYTYLCCVPEKLLGYKLRTILPPPYLPINLSRYAYVL